MIVEIVMCETNKWKSKGAVIHSVPLPLYRYIAISFICSNVFLYSRHMLMMRILVLAGTLVALCQAGDGDTYDQLKWGYSNFPMQNATFKSPVTMETGSIPHWLSGKLKVVV